MPLNEAATAALDAAFGAGPATTAKKDQRYRSVGEALDAAFSDPNATTAAPARGPLSRAFSTGQPVIDPQASFGNAGRGLLAAGRSLVEGLTTPTTTGRDLYARYPWLRYTPVPGALDVAERLGAIPRSLAQLGPEKAQPLTEALLSGAMGAGRKFPQPFARVLQGPTPAAVTAPVAEHLTQLRRALPTREPLALPPRSSASVPPVFEVERPAIPQPPVPVPRTGYQAERVLPVKGGPALEGEVLDQFGRPVQAEAPTMTERDRLRSLYRSRLDDRPDLRGPSSTGVPAEASYAPPAMEPAPRTPRFERTPTGEQAMIPGAEARVMPSTALRTRVAQQPASETPLFQPKETATQPALPEAPRPRGQYYGSTVDTGTASLSDPEEVRIMLRDRGGLDPSSHGFDKSAVPKDLLRPGGVKWDELVQEVADAQGKRPRDVDRQLSDTLGKLLSHKTGVQPMEGLAEIRGGAPPTDVPLGLDEWRAMGPAQRRSALDFFRAAFTDEGGRLSASVFNVPAAQLERVSDDLRATLAPASRGPEAAREAGILRSNLAELARKTERAHAVLKKAELWMEGLPESQRYAFIDALEAGRVPKKGSTAETLRSMLDQRRVDVQNLGTGKLEHFIEDYYPHLWKDPQQAAQALEQAAAQAYGRRPLAGTGAFLKRRTIPTVAEGRALGLEPVTSNPVTATLLKLREMDRYVMGQTVLQEMKTAGLARVVPYDARPPAGWTRINDKIARAGSAGQYWAPEPAARLLNNHLSSGLQGHALYDAFRGLGNTLNQAQLGFSAFHLGFVSVDTMISKSALGLQQLFAGQPMQAAKSLLSVPTAPFTSYLKGSKVLREYYAPGAGGQEMAGVVDALIQAGGRARMDRFYGGNVLNDFWKALRGGQYGRAALKSFPAILEAVSKPVMEEFVPRVKMGVFADLAKFELGKLPPGTPRAEVQRVLGRAWDSVDNRLGQVVYDNLFWNRAGKDLALASVRSVGWNLGTFRELGGGVSDVLRQPSRIARGQGFEMTPRMAYTATLPFIAGLYGAIYHYLATGQGPQELKDYYFPKTGRQRPDGTDDRVSLPSYMKDVYAYAQHPWTTVKHKLNPELGMLSEMLENQDFYGAQIRNPDDPIVRQMLDEVAYIGRGMESFSVRGLRQQLQTGASPAQAAQGFIGITPAPASVTRTGEEQRAIERKREAQSRRKKERRDEGGLAASIEERLRDAGYLK